MTRARPSPILAQVTLFKPERKVNDPEGRTWEIYVRRASFLSRVRLAEPPRIVEIEATCFFPGRTTHRWTTVSEHADSVVDQIVRGLEAGELARPLGSNYTDPRIRPGADLPWLEDDTPRPLDPD